MSRLKVGGGAIITPASAIGKYLGVSSQVIYKWIKNQGFPAGKLPRGGWFTTPTLIDQWILTLNPYVRKMLQEEETTHDARL